MSISGSLGFTKEKASLIETINTETIKKEEELQKQKQLEQQLTTERGITTTLGTETQQLITDLVGQISAGVVSPDTEGLAELTQAILERSKTAQADVSGQISAITEDARLKGEQELQQLQSQLAQQAGGSLANTLVASATGVGRANLESQLARTKGELNLQARQVVSDELSAALTGVSQAQTQAQQTPIENITNLLNVLKGATVEQEQVGERQTTAESELSRLLDSIATTESLRLTQTKGLTLTGEISGGNPVPAG